MSEYKTIEQAKSLFDLSDSQLADLHEKNKIDLVFRYMGGVAHNETIEKLNGVAHKGTELDADDEPYILEMFNKGITSADFHGEHTGHFSFECSGWFICNSAKSLSEDKYQITARVFEVVSSQFDLEEGSAVAFFKNLSVNSLHSIMPERGLNNCGLIINRDMLHIPLAQLEKLSSTNRKPATNRKKTKLIVKSLPKKLDSTESEKTNNQKIQRPISELPQQGMSRANELLPFLPFGKTTLWNWSKTGKFPPPTKISDGITAWSNEKIHEWFKNQNS